MAFDFIPTIIKDVILVKPRIFKDQRGFFMEAFKKSEFAHAGIKDEFVQDNMSRSRKDVIRGLHYQKAPHAQGKLVQAFQGRIWDVAVDIRKSSPTFKRWVAYELDDENRLMLYIPPGFAHGFVALTEEAVLSYKCTEEYAPDVDTGIIWSDPDLAVDWPVNAPIISEKDGKLPNLAEAYLFE